MAELVEVNCFFFANDVSPFLGSGEIIIIMKIKYT